MSRGKRVVMYPARMNVAQKRGWNQAGLGLPILNVKISGMREYDAMTAAHANIFGARPKFIGGMILLPT
jgi:hypothetical protein